MTTFTEWMQRVRQLKRKSIEKYDGALDGALSDWAQQNGIYAGKLSEIRDLNVFVPIANSISNLTVFQERNATGHHMYGASLSRYKDFLIWRQNGEELSGDSSLVPELEVVRKAWIERIQEFETRHHLINTQLNQKSPKFQYGNWCVGAEHQRKFRSVVLKWLGPSETVPARVSTWEHCPETERIVKGWVYRRYMALDDLESLLVELSESHLTQELFNKVQEQRLAEAFKRTSAARDERLANADKKPRSYDVKTRVFDRNYDVVVAVLLRANGHCEDCGEPAPFRRSKDQSPYLEVHHRIPLAENGDDTVENAVAICPNCHRKAHYG